MNFDRFEEAVEARRFDVAYEPIVELTTGLRCAYEALARFHGRDGAQIPTPEIFAWIHTDPARLAAIECALKAAQVAHAPGAPLFVNLDPDSQAAAKERRLPVLAALEPHGHPLVVEVVESARSSDAGPIRRMIREVRESGFGVALDDLGARTRWSHSRVSFRWTKIERSVLAAIADLRYRNLFECVIALARKNGTRTVLEGVEARADLEIAEELGVDLVQGSLFRDQCIMRAQPKNRRRSSGRTRQRDCA